MYSAKKNKGKKIKEQQRLFSEDKLLPTTRPTLNNLIPSDNLSAVFNECHNYIYANEGMLKDKVFHEIVKLLMMKLYDEKNPPLRFGINAQEYRDIATEKTSSFKNLEILFREVRAEYKDFFSDNKLKLKPLTLAYIVGKLQYISLEKTPGDVKGEAFQTFVYSYQRGARGEYFTPHPVVKLAVNMIEPQPHEKIIDPASGSGGFLLESIRHIKENHPSVDIKKYIQNSIRGIEFNPDVALSAMVRMAFEGGTGKEIIHKNALIKDKKLENSFDIILTNPPFGNKGKVEERAILENYTLAHRWTKGSEENQWKATKSMLGRLSPEILFIEKSLNLLRPGGRMAVVLPDGLLQNVSNAHIRYWLRKEAKILGVISIPQEAFIPYGTGIKTSMLILQKYPSNTKKVFMSRIKKIGYDVKAQPIYKRNNQGVYLKNSVGEKIIDDDIEKITLAYENFKNKTIKNETDSAYTLSENMLNSRLDVEHYLLNDLHLINSLKKHDAKALGDLVTILHHKDDFRKNPETQFRYISISDVDGRTMQVISQQNIKTHEAPSRASYRLKEGDIITAIAGANTGTPRQATALITEDEDGAICTNGFAVLRDFVGVEPLYLLAYLNTEYYLRQVKRLMTGHAIPAISLSDLAKVLIPIPPKNEQEKIARSILSIFETRKKATLAKEKTIENTVSFIKTAIGTL